MILILGNSSDSLLYIKTMLRQTEEKKECSSFFSSYQGKLYGQDVLVAETGLSTYRAALVASHMMEKYSPYLTIYLGDALTCSHEIGVGSIQLPDNVALADVNQLPKDPNTVLNAVPGFPPVYTIPSPVHNLFTEAASSVNLSEYQEGSVLSSNQIPRSLKDLTNFDAPSFSSLHRGGFTFQSECGGVCLAAQMENVSFMPILTVAGNLEDSSSLDAKKIVLERSVDVGKIIIATIATISSDENTYIRGDEFDVDHRMKF